MEDLNFRPRHYQWRTLTSWANRPESNGYVSEIVYLIWKINGKPLRYFCLHNVVAYRIRTAIDIAGPACKAVKPKRYIM